MAFLRIPPSNFAQDRAKLFARAPSKIYFGHIASFTVLTYLAWDVLPVLVLVVWAAWEILGTPVLLHRLTKSVPNTAAPEADLTAWQNRLHGLFAIVGWSWGLFVALGLDVENPAHFSIQMAIVAGACASASRSLGIFRYSFYFYAVPFTGLLALRIFLLGGDYVLLGILVLIFMGMLCRLANDTSEELSDYLATKVENLDLAQKFERAAQEANAANLAKTQFLVQANHDLRQPIHAISLLSACLRDQPLDQEGREILDTIDTSVENLANLFKSLLNITSLDTGTIQTDVSTFDLNTLLAQVVRQAQPEAIEFGTELTHVSTSVWVETDKALLTSILQNLVFNAVNYARGKRVLIGVRRHRDSVSVEVLDQGVGMSEELQSRVFDEFERGNPHGPNRVEGLGLGLAIVARTAQLLDLKVVLESIEGRGSHLALCNLKTARNPHIAERPYADGTETPFVNQTIMIIDDNLQILAGLQMLLHKWHYKVIALEPRALRFPAEAPDILISDFHLNIESNGLDLAQEIADRYGRNIPTAIISGTLTPELEGSANTAGFWTLLKPVSPRELRSILLAIRQKTTCSERTQPKA